MNEHLDFWIDHYLDGELPTGLLSQVEEHLQSCSSCQKLLQERQKLSALLQQVPSAEPAKSEAQFVADLRASMVNTPPGKLILPYLPDPILANEGAFFWTWTAVSMMILLATVFFQTVGFLQLLLEVVPGEHQVVLGQMSMSSLWPQLTLPEPASGFLRQVGWFGLLDWNWLANLVVMGLLGLLMVSCSAAWLVRSQITNKTNH